MGDDVIAGERVSGDSVIGRDGRGLKRPARELLPYHPITL